MNAQTTTPSSIRIPSIASGTNPRQTKGTTRRQQKHEMLVAFMANAKTPVVRRNPAPTRPAFLKTLLSFFL